MGKIKDMTAPSVCLVVNAVGETSVPADIATSLVRYTELKVDILAWFNADGFQQDHLVNIKQLGAPDTTIGIDRATISETVSILKEYDLVQVHHNHSGSFVKVIARKLGIPSVSREGNMRIGFSRKGLIANGITNPLADRVVCNSQAVYDSFRRWESMLLPESKIVFIPNGVDFDRINAGKQLAWNPRNEINIDQNTILISTVGSITRQKNQRILIQAVNEVIKKTDRQVALCIAGSGPLKKELQRFSKELDIQANIYFLGRLNRLEVYKLLIETDIYAMPSKWEGFSAAALEALATNNAAVFSDISPFIGPYSEVAEFHSINDHRTLASHLVELIENPSKRHEMAKSGQKLVEQKYQMESIAREYRNLYFEIINI